MNKAQLAKELARRNDFLFKDMEAILSSLEEIFADCIIEGEKISWVGFLELESKQVERREMQDPRWGTPIVCEGYTKPVIRFKKTFKDKIKIATRKS